MTVNFAAAAKSVNEGSALGSIQIGGQKIGFDRLLEWHAVSPCRLIVQSLGWLPACDVLGARICACFQKTALDSMGAGGSEGESGKVGGTAVGSFLRNTFWLCGAGGRGGPCIGVIQLAIEKHQRVYVSHFESNEKADDGRSSQACVLKKASDGRELMEYVQLSVAFPSK